MKAPFTFLLAAGIASALAQQAPKINRIPPPGVEVPANDRAEIEAGLKQLAAEIAKLKANPKFAAELPNVEIFHKSADWALRYDEFFDPKQIAIAKDHIQQGLARAAALAKGETPWNTATGLVVRGYRSKIDGSVQPYGVLIPEGLKPGAKVPLHFWCHGRGEKLSELSFIDGSQKNKGEFTPEGSIVCYLYGRFCNANKFAGEVDLFEAKADIEAHYPIDQQRLVVRGFSMGGAACWQFATHHSGLWAAAAPGAGFAETAEFFKSFGEGKDAPPWWEQVLWRWYDCTTMAGNLANTTTVAYSGEIDGQKQAADIMVKYAGQEGITFPHIIGPQTPHKYHPDSKPEINKLVDAAVVKGLELFPKRVRLETHSLIYPTSRWVTIRQIERGWERAEVDATYEDGVVVVKTKNISELSLQFFSELDLPDRKIQPVGKIVMNGTTVVDGDTRIAGNPVLRDDFSGVSLKLSGNDWVATEPSYKLPLEGYYRLASLVDFKIKKTSQVCGPIDHAFMSPFVFVRPTGKALNKTVGDWTQSEMARAIAQWRQVFRGDVRIIDDTEVTDEIAANNNLALWGDVSSNSYIAALSKLPDALPVKWNSKSLTLRSVTVDASNHVPIFIFPNPSILPSPNAVQRYVVLNSGPTFREAAALNNSDQTPKLPDWAVVDLRTPPGPKWPGQIVDAGFFDESWK
jgi:hypothetical protein